MLQSSYRIFPSGSRSYLAPASGNDNGLAEVLDDSKKISWQDMHRYANRKFRKRLNGKQRTIFVIDIELGGNVVISERVKGYWYQTTWEQDKFLKWVRSPGVRVIDNYTNLINRNGIKVKED